MFECPSFGKSLVTSASIGVLLTACAAIPGTNPPASSGLKREDGFKLCQRVEGAARLNAIEHRNAGWVLGGLALGVAATGVGVAASDQPQNDAGKNRYKVAVAVLPLAGGLLAYFAQGQFSMAENSSSLAATAANAVNLPSEPESNKTCNAAISTWDADSNTASSAFASAVAKEAQGAPPKDGKPDDSGKNEAEPNTAGTSATPPAKPGPNAPAGQAPAPTTPPSSGD